MAAHLNRILVFVASLAPLVLHCGTLTPFAFSPPTSSNVAPPGCRNVDQRTVNCDQMNLYACQLHVYMNKIKITRAESFQMNKSFVVNVNQIIWLHLMLSINNFAKTHSTCGLSHHRVGAEWVSVMRQPCLKQCVLTDYRNQLQFPTVGRRLTLSFSSFSLSALASFNFFSISFRSSKFGLL